ncbi:hypothetical protein C8T65DRAFT_662100 [Cerioporus squamosus]|nr:hypothetical protein C8T65DRAFT_662100 [Cerioporus squamosus]
MPRLRILAGPSMSDLVPIHVDSGVPVKVSSDAFEGQLAVFIKGFADEEGKVRDSDYFRKRSGVTWSIQMQGRFLKEYTAGRPALREHLRPPAQGTLGIQRRRQVHELHRPHARARPRIQLEAMGALAAHRDDAIFRAPTHRAGRPRAAVPAERAHRGRYNTAAHEERCSERQGRKVQNSPSKRRGYFTNAPRRQEVVFGPEDLITTDFCYDFLTFSPDGILLKLPGGLSIEMTKYWDGQPVRFVCCERLKKEERTAERAWGRILWCVVIEPVADGDDDLREKGSTRTGSTNSGSSESLASGSSGDVD